MLDPIYDECGVAAVYRMDRPPPNAPKGEILSGNENIVRFLPNMLIDLQNRGQLAAGITRYNENALQIIDTYKRVGSVSDVFHLTVPDPAKFEKILQEYSGRAGIGHVRYATCGRDDASFAQPFERHEGRKWKWFAFGFNGNIANYPELRANLVKKGYHLIRDTDTELLHHHFCYALERKTKPDFVDVFRQIAHYVDGAYSLVFLNAEGDLIVARDPYGFRPLCYAVKGNLFAAASESIALKNLGFSEVHDVEPGTLIHVTRDGFETKTFAEPPPRRSFCFFEYVYFANVASNLNGRSVYLTRTRLGEALAETEEVETDPVDCVAVPVPDTAKAACDAMAYRLGIPSREGLIRNRYVGRTFIEGSNRTERVKRKFSALPEVLAGKRVFLVEDSIVRATTLHVIVKMLREQGRAREIHVRVACPPILAPCSYGIDMSTVRELFAPKFLESQRFDQLTPEASQKLADELGTDSLRYLTIPQLVDGIRAHRNELCLGCLTGQYPTKWGNKNYAKAKREKDCPQSGRTYEQALTSNPEF